MLGEEEMAELMDAANDDERLLGPLGMTSAEPSGPRPSLAAGIESCLDDGEVMISVEEIISKRRSRLCEFNQ